MFMLSTHHVVYSVACTVQAQEGSGCWKIDGWMLPVYDADRQRDYPSATRGGALEVEVRDFAAGLQLAISC